MSPTRETTPTGRRHPPIPWVRVLLLAAVGTALGVSLTLLDLGRTADLNGGLIHTGPDGPAAALLAAHFPDEEQFEYGEHDGPMFYAVALHPFDLHTAAESLDRPRYRLQHPLFSWLAALANPWTDGGPTLLWTMFAVGVAAMLLAGVSGGALSATLGGPLWLAAVIPVLPGATVSLRITVADTLALGLVLAAIVASLRSRTALAVLLAVAAVLTKEPMILTLFGFALWRRDRTGVLLVAVPAAVAGAWALYLRWAVPTSGDEVIEFGIPLEGLWGAVRHWAGGNDLYAFIGVGASLVLAVWCLVKRGPAHPLWFPVLVNLGFLLLLNRTVLGLERNGTRMTMTLLVLALCGVIAPRVGRSLPAALVRTRSRVAASG